MKKVIIDCDAGYDDAVALVLLIAAHKRKELQIKAVTCVNGNAKLDHVVRNVFRILEACNALDIPVYRGAQSALIEVKTSIKAANFCYHGQDGFGDILTDQPDVSRLQSEHAVAAIHRIITENPNEISLVCLGPLTNIALVIKLYPEVLDIIKDFYIMGGNLAGVGNITSQAEFNFYADCESAHIVLGSNKKPLWLVPWETCIKSTISRHWRDNVLGKQTTKAVELVNKVENGIYLKQKKGEFYLPCDAFAAAVLLNPDIVIKKKDCHADIELAGTRTRGQVVLDHRQDKAPNIHMVEEIDFKELGKEWGRCRTATQAYRSSNRLCPDLNKSLKATSFRHFK